MIKSAKIAAILAGIDKLRHRQNHCAPLSEPIGDSLFELRHVGKLNTPAYSTSL